MHTLLTQNIGYGAERAPRHPAIVFEDVVLDYATLEGRSNALANTLVACGVRRHDRVGICMDKCAETAVALYGIMKAGAAYVPLDPSAPVERLEFVIRDCGITRLVTASGKRRVLDQLIARQAGLEVLLGIDSEPLAGVHCVPWREVFDAPHSLPHVRILEQDLAYVIYTSGSTGIPKGIMHTHHSGLSFARWAAREYDLRADDRLANHSPLHFDISIFDFFAGSHAGATTVIIGEPYLKLPASYSELLSREHVTVLFTVPFALIQLLLRGVLEERDLNALRWVIFGGEPFPPKHLHALMARLPGATFDNMYGPAEVNGCTHHTIRSFDFDDGVPIGHVADIAKEQIVDDEGQPVAPGTVGELLVCTPTMMRGYWGRTDLTEQAFLSRQVCPGVNDTYYRTGDLVRQDETGVLHFLGRRDRQVKIRGYRVELDEVELGLTSCDAVEEAAAFTVDRSDGARTIRAAVTLKDTASIDHASILKHARSRLPWYALPEQIEIRDAFPRTTSGKIDRRRLWSEVQDLAAPNVSSSRNKLTGR